MAISRVDTAKQFDIEYPRCRNWLIEALKHTREFTERDILDGLDTRDFLLWTSPNAACITQISKYENDQSCVLILVGGERGKALREILVEGQSEIIAYALNVGCKTLVGSPRKEWTRVLIKDGFEVDNKDNFYKGL